MLTDDVMLPVFNVRMTTLSTSYVSIDKTVVKEGGLVLPQSFDNETMFSSIYTKQVLRSCSFLVRLFLFSLNVRWYCWLISGVKATRDVIDSDSLVNHFNLWQQNMFLRLSETPVD